MHPHVRTNLLHRALSAFGALVTSVAPEMKLRWDLRRYDLSMEQELKRRRAGKRSHEEIENVEGEWSDQRWEFSGPLRQHRHDKLIAEGRKVGVHLKDAYGEQDPYEYDLFGSRFLEDERPFEKAVRAAQKEAEKHFRERWAFRFGITVGIFSLLKETLPAIAKPMREIVLAAVAMWKN